MIEVQSRTSCEDLIKEKDKEIGKLVDELEEQERHIKEANIEIERLNNIINELEKWVKEDTEKSMMTMETGRAFNMFDILDKLQELKGEE